MTEVQIPATTEESKRTRKLGQLTWCRCDDRDGWLHVIDVPGMDAVGDVLSAKKLLSEYLDSVIENVEETQRFRLIRDVEEVTPKIKIQRKVTF
jgi:hypothetical protein